MKPEAPNRLSRAFTLIELLVVVAIVAVLILMVFPTHPEAENKARAVACLSNLKQVGVACLSWADDHEERFPWKTSQQDGGTLDLVQQGQVAPHFLVLSNSISGDHKYFFRLLACPSDRVRLKSEDFQVLSDSNISFFINLDAVTKNATSILAGDRHLQVDGKTVQPGLNSIGTNKPIEWTRELHRRLKRGPSGGLLFADGHAELVSGDLTERFVQQGRAESRLVVP